MSALLIVVGLYLTLAVYVALQQRTYIFPAPPRGRTPAHADRLVKLSSGQSFIYLPGAPVVVHFHGNGEDLADAGSMIDLLRSLGVGVLAAEYPGYGISPGRASEDALYASAEMALHWLRDEQHVPPERVVLQGQSLGSGLAAEMARRGLGGRLILISPFTSMASLGQRFFPWLPVAPLVRHRFDTLSKAPGIGVPVLIVHGTEDELVPFSMGEELARVFPRATLRPIPGGHHNDLLWLHAREVRAAIAEVVGR